MRREAILTQKGGAGSASLGMSPRRHSRDLGLIRACQHTAQVAQATPLNVSIASIDLDVSSFEAHIWLYWTVVCHMPSSDCTGCFQELTS